MTRQTAYRWAVTCLLLVAVQCCGGDKKKAGEGAFAFAFDDEERILLNTGDAVKVEAPMVIFADKKAAGGKCLFTPEGPACKEINPGWDPTKDKEPAGKGLALFKFNVPEDTKYDLWVRANWHCGCGNSVWIQLDNGRPRKLGDDGTYRKWHWVKYISPRRRRGPALRLKKGPHTLAIINREDGAKIDQILFKTDDTKPVGIEE